MVAWWGASTSFQLYRGSSDDQDPISKTALTLLRIGDDEADTSCVLVRSAIFSYCSAKTAAWQTTLTAPHLETMSASQVYIAGVGISFSSQQDLTNGATEAGARALLDAGITYAKVQLSVACSLDEAEARIPRECFKTFGRQKSPLCSMDSHSALHILAQCIRTGQIDCAMLVGLDKVRCLWPSSFPIKLTGQPGSCRPTWQYRKGIEPDG